MALSGRIWQFMFGFLAHHWYSSSSLKGEPKKYYLYVLLILALIVTLMFGVPLLEKQWIRLVVILVAFLLVGQENLCPRVMSNELLVTLGDISYSVYLVHWPLFTWYRYANMDEEGVGFSCEFFDLNRENFSRF
jgi:peptidoglycan/LPS O-acetylase OafA/YrhL